MRLGSKGLGSKGLAVLVPLVASLVAGTGATGTGATGGSRLVEATQLRAHAGRSASSTTGQGFWMVTRAGRVIAYGDAQSFGDAHAETPVVGAATTPDGRGYWLATGGGGVYGFGDAARFGSLGGRHLTSPVVGIAATGDGKGYWLATGTGTVYGFGDASGHGPAPGTVLPAPVVGIVTDPATGGFWLATSTGTVLGYDGAPSYGQAHLPSAVVAMAATPDGRGYWVVAQDGRTATLGDAGRHGALNGAYSRPVVGMAPAPTGDGYWLAAANGHVFAYGDAGDVAPPPGSPRVVAIVAAPPIVGAPRITAGAPGPSGSTPSGSTPSGSTGALTVVTTALPAASVSVAYTAQLAGQGGTPPYTWAIGDGTLPPGLSLSPAGAISGAPSTAGSYTFTAEVTDGARAPAHASAQLSIAVAPPQLSQVPVSQVPSGNWSGYVATAGPYTAASGTFTVPSVSPGAPPQDLVSEWVGIDGSGNGSLIQAGVTEVPDTTTSVGPDVFAWWEVLPLASQPIATMAVNPGDEVSITISQVSGTSWAIHLTDGTNGQDYTQDVSYSGPGTSAEWVVEAPTDAQGDQQLPLAPYSPAVDFSGLSASGSSTALSEVVMDQEDQQVSTPSALTFAGFSVAYGATAPVAP